MAKASWKTPTPRSARRSARRYCGSPVRLPALCALGGRVDPASGHISDPDCERAAGCVEEEVVAGRDDDEQHHGRIAPADRACDAALGEHGDGDADEQRVAEMKARDSRERVVETAEEVRAQVDLRVVRDGVHEA